MTLKNWTGKIYRGKEIFTGDWVYGMLGEEHGRTIIANDDGVYTVSDKTI